LSNVKTYKTGAALEFSFSVNNWNNTTFQMKFPSIEVSSISRSQRLD
jgi:hypothetical protein